MSPPGDRYSSSKTEMEEIQGTPTLATQARMHVCVSVRAVTSRGKKKSKHVCLLLCVRTKTVIENLDMSLQVSLRTTWNSSTDLFQLHRAKQ